MTDEEIIAEAVRITDGPQPDRAMWKAHMLWAFARFIARHHVVEHKPVTDEEVRAAVEQFRKGHAKDLITLPSPRPTFAEEPPYLDITSAADVCDGVRRFLRADGEQYTVQKETYTVPDGQTWVRERVRVFWTDEGGELVEVAGGGVRNYPLGAATEPTARMTVTATDGAGPVWEKDVKPIDLNVTRRPGLPVPKELKTLTDAGPVVEWDPFKSDISFTLEPAEFAGQTDFEKAVKEMAAGKTYSFTAEYMRTEQDTPPAPPAYPAAAVVVRCSGCERNVAIHEGEAGAVCICGRRVGR